MKANVLFSLIRVLIDSRLLISIAFIILSYSLSAQNENLFPKELTKEDTVTIEAIALYPKDDRIAIFEVCQYPQLLVALDQGQTNAQNTFRIIIFGLSKNDQEKIYELVRYPEIIKGIVREPNKSKEELSNFLTVYPENIREIAISFKQKHFNELEKINNLYSRIDEGLEYILKDYSDTTKQSVRRLIDLPEAITLLIDNLKLSITIGEMYKKQPERVIERSIEFNKELVARNEKELIDYQLQLKNDPNAYAEMLAAADKYAEDNNLTDHKNSQNPDVTVQVNTPYPYWYGYPYWYEEPLWRPVPWYYHTGFYYAPNGAIVFIGLPSPYYVGWHHFYYPNAYVHLSFHYHRHCLRHNYSHSSFHHSVELNVTKNTNVNINRNINIRKSNDVKLSRNLKRDKKANQVGQKRNKAGYQQHIAIQNHQQRWNKPQVSSFSKPARGNFRSLRRR